jgi:LysR family glycine cleavage system transcriptional activator
MRRDIPSLSTLLAFESAAQLSSFTRAAGALNLTQGAVSRHVRGLEERLGVKLFERVGQRVMLTAAGERYRRAIAPSLDALEQATRTMVHPAPERGVLHVIIPPTFGARWLVPRLPLFAAAHGDLRLRLSVRGDTLPEGENAFDAAIVGGVIPPAGGMECPLVSGRIVPVASPALGTDDPWSAPPLELGPAGAWAAFAHACHRPPPRGVTTFDYFDAGIQAAIAGQGVLLVMPFLVLAELRSGALRVADAASLDGQPGYRLCLPRRRRNPGATDRFRGWIAAALTETAAEVDAVLAPCQ